MHGEIVPRVHHDALKRLAALLRADLPALVDETEVLLDRERPDLVARADPALARVAITHTHARFATLLDGDVPDERDRHVAFGAAMAGAGIGVEELQAGYRIGAQVGWRHVARHAAVLELPSDVVLALASAAMAYADELAANSLEGFARAAAAVQGARARECQALLDALLAGRDEDAGALAATAGWALPTRLRVAVLLGPATALDDRALLLGHSGGAAVAVARDEEAAATLLSAGAALAVGPAVAPEQAPLSLARARRVAALVHDGVLAADRAHTWEDCLPDLVVHADAAAVEALVAVRLAPLDGLPPARERLLRETLAAWLQHPGRPREIARTLHLHHQTVRYRLGRLRERFGDDLDDPAARFELALALRCAGSGS
jgi:hypothetical protein